MSKRLPTAEEKALWRETNKFTRKKQPDEVAEEAVETAVVTPSLRRGSAVTIPPKPADVTPPHYSELTPLPAREAKKRRAPHPAVQATLDLHGLTRAEAHGQVRAFLARAHRAGRRHVVIITGKGRASEGVLRQELPHWLNDAPLRPLIASIFYAPDREGGTGVMHVLLKKA